MSSVVTLFRHHIHLSSIVQVLFEGALLFAVVALVLMNGPYGQHAGLAAVLAPALSFMVIMLAANAAFGLYSSDRRIGVGSLVLRLLCAVVIGMLVTSIVFRFFPSEPGQLNGALIAGLMAGMLSTLLSRTALVPRLATSIAAHRILVLGVSEQARSAELAIEQSGIKGIEIVGFAKSRTDETQSVSSQRVFGADRPLTQLTRQLGVAEIIIAVKEQRGGAIAMDELLACRLRGIRVTPLADFLERTRGAVPLGSFNASWLVYGDGFSQGRLRSIVKRGFDILVSGALLVAAAPIMLVTAVLIRLESAGGVIYRQQRVGRGSDLFDVLKFRSMAQDAEKDGKPRWAAVGDSRVTRIGRFIRRTRIDELPQLLNVLRGEMSFVGPRPERPFFVEQLTREIPFYGLRHSVKPGITGWAQVRYSYGATVEDAAKKLEYDLYYVKNHSLFLDLVVLLETVRVVIFGEGVR